MTENERKLTLDVSLDFSVAETWLRWSWPAHAPVWTHGGCTRTELAHLCFSTIWSNVAESRGSVLKSCQMPAGMPQPLFTGSLAAFSEFQLIPLPILSCVNYISEHGWCVVDLMFLCKWLTTNLSTSNTPAIDVLSWAARQRTTPAIGKMLFNIWT